MKEISSFLKKITLMTRKIYYLKYRFEKGLFLPKRLIFLIITSLIIITSFAQNNKTENNANTFPKRSDRLHTKLTYKITKVVNNTYGYNIFSNGKLLIHQTTIPGIPGMEGFKKKSAAEKVAKLIISKIAKGEIPPTITIEEMKKIKAI